MIALSKPATGVLLVLTMFLHTAYAGDCPAPASPSYLGIESPASGQTRRQLGTGSYSYRFVVRDPQRINRPFRSGRYQIELKGEATFPDGTHFHRGTTDRLGRTIAMRFNEPVAPDAWYVQPLVGRGEYGESFRLIDETGCASAPGNLPYLINDQLGGLFCGKTLPDGSTIRTMSTTPRTMSLYQMPTDECRALQRAVNLAMAHPSPAKRIKAMQRLLASPRPEEHINLLQGKIDALLIRYGSLEQIKTLVAQKLASAASNEHASILNSIAYELLTQTPPRLLNTANCLLDQSLAIEENAFNLDSKAWALHLLGRNEEALAAINRSLAAYGSTCSEEENSAYPESLAHRGMIRWSLKQYSEAMDDWTLASLATQAGGWANFTPSWNSIEPLIKARAAELKDRGIAPAVCRKTTTDET